MVYFLPHWIISENFIFSSKITKEALRYEKVNFN